LSSHIVLFLQFYFSVAGGCGDLAGIVTHPALIAIFLVRPVFHFQENHRGTLPVGM
jgi:hypothetical protein